MIFKAFAPMRSPYLLASARSSEETSVKQALGVSSLQYAAKQREIPTQEQLNSPMIHFSSAAAVPSGEALMKSPVHHKGTGSSAKPKAGITCGRSSFKKFFV